MRSTFLPGAIRAAAQLHFRSAPALIAGLLSLLGSLTAGAQSGQTSAADMHRLQQQVTTLTARVALSGFLVSGVLLVFMGCACLALWWKARTFRGFRSAGLYLLSVAAVLLVAYVSRTSQYPFIVLTSLLMPEMAADILGIAKGRWIWLNRFCCIVALMLVWTPRWELAYRISVDISELCVLVLLIIGLRVRNARQYLIGSALGFIWFFRAPIDPFVGRYIPMAFYIGGSRWNVGPIAMVLFGAVAIAVFVGELMADQREKERLAGELEAGRAMQQVLLGREMPSTPVLRVQSTYKPASEVGGDFFQALPAGDGGALLILGDVSGKGLRAAMTVSTILGALQMLPGAAPAELLRALNQALAGKLQGGFVTCCIAQISSRGMVRVANAGHLAPYRNGEEVVVESGLPLGLTEDADYPESTFALSAGDQLTLLSDGVVEAQDVSGELFGFDRTAAISTQSAESIAHAAQQFGQEDDITVLTLKFAPAEVLHA